MATTVTSVPTIKQGDAYYLPVHLYFNGEEINADLLDMLEEIEFALADLEPVRLTPAESYSEALGCFLLPLTQKQTFELEEGRTTTLDVRVQFLGGNVLGVRQKAKMKVLDATSEEVI